jgi:predicted nucleotidyltransferase component of viral defense system
MSDAPVHTRAQEFIAAVEFTSAQTGFSGRLIEKDYWCSLVLGALFASRSRLVFEGGTLLSKAYTGFSRLSEDLDLTISTSSEATRAERSRRAHEVGALLEGVRRLLGMEWAQTWKGHNSSRQHTGTLAYPSILGGAGNILLEVGQRELLERPAKEVQLKTILLEPLFLEPALPPVKVMGLSRDEAYAEKARAALTRKEPAIRDIYNLWQAFEDGGLPVNDPGWIALVRQKCAAYDLGECCSTQRQHLFERSLETDLRPVLRSGAMEAFDFEAAWAVVFAVHQKLLGKQG